MTNLALAQKLDPDFAATARELVYMGGSLNPHQELVLGFRATIRA